MSDIEWRPHEPGRETTVCNSCNLHEDCDAADQAFRRQHPEGLQHLHGVQTSAIHCWAENCEECRGC